MLEERQTILNNNYRMRKYLFIFAITVLGICFMFARFEKVDFSTPAKKHIDEYTKKLQNCIKSKAQDEAERAAAAKVREEHTKKEIIKSEELKHSSALESAFEVKPQDIVLGNLQSKVIVIEYFALTCPHCADFHKNTFPKIKEKYIDTDKIAYIIREFAGSKQDLDGAVLIRCGDDREKSLHLLNTLLAMQDNWAFTNQYRERLTRIAGFEGISAERYDECLNDKSIVNFLAQNAQQIARNSQFTGTPSFFINGELLKGAHVFDVLAEAIDKAINNVSK